MSCCGAKRESWHSKSPVPPQAEGNNIHIVYFRYLGNKAITVVGSVTGRTYQFPGRGSTVAADQRDAFAMALVPHVIRVNYQQLAG